MVSVDGNSLAGKAAVWKGGVDEEGLCAVERSEPRELRLGGSMHM